MAQPRLTAKSCDKRGDMTQRDGVEVDENAPPGSHARRRASSAGRDTSRAKQANVDKDVSPVASTSFYGGSPSDHAHRRPLQTMRSHDAGNRTRSRSDGQRAMDLDRPHREGQSTKPQLGIDLDDDDTQFPKSPTPDVEAVNDSELPAYQSPEAGYPDALRISVNGRGWLPNVILGHSQSPRFHAGLVFEWDDRFRSQDLVDFDLNTSFTFSSAKAAASADAAPGLSSPAPMKAKSYANAAQQTGDSESVNQRGDTPSLKFTTDMLKAARPHQRAFYNVASHAWTILCTLPRSAQEAKSQYSKPPTSCSSPAGQRRAHHYVCVPSRVDPRFILNPSQVPVGQSRKPFETVSLLDGPDMKVEFGGPSNAPPVAPWDDSDACWHVVQTPMRYWWDLHVCSGCRHAFAISPTDFIPSVLGLHHCNAFVQARLDEERERGGDSDPNATLKSSLEYLWKVVRNVLYDGNTSAIPITGTTFVRRMGTSNAALDMFTKLRFTKSSKEGQQATLVPPPLGPDTLALLSRGFLELSLWLSSLSESNSQQTIRQTVLDLVTQRPFVSALPDIIGADPLGTDTARPGDFQNTQEFQAHYAVLGVTPETADDDIVFAYHCQIDSDPSRLPYYLDSLKEISTLRGGNRDALQMQLTVELSQDRSSQSEINAALQKLGYEPVVGPQQAFTGIDAYVNPSEEDIGIAYMAAREAVVQRQGTESDLNELKQALSLLAKAFSSAYLKTILESMSASKPTVGPMTLDEAYSFLQCAHDIADTLLCTTVQFNYLEDSGTSDYQKQKAKVALEVIAQNRQSGALQKFLNTGMMPDAMEPETEAPISLDRPAGLQNVGNTCYLNSLLQYFFTVKQLREIVLSFEEYAENRSDAEIATSKRVGGRQITSREIERSKKFTGLLSSLYTQLICTPAASVKPELDLAYLALVSTRDEEANSLLSPTQQPTSPMADKAASSTGHRVDDSSSIEANIAGSDVQHEVGASSANGGEQDDQRTKVGSPSVLGKRTSEHFDEDVSGMDVDGRDIAASRSTDSATKQDPRDQPSTMVAQAGEDGVMEIIPESQLVHKTPETSAVPPPLPARGNSSTALKSNMMFGRQNDVSEAMDNVIFQIEIALDDTKIPKSPESARDDTTSFVQSLFYGMNRQTLTLEGESMDRVQSGAFSYLLVDVSKEGGDLYDGLDAVYEPSTVEVDGKKAIKNDVLTRLPPILQIQLQRVQFDKASAKVYKSNAYMPFPQTLRMGRYLTPEGRDPTFLEKQQTSTRLRHEIATLRRDLADLERKDSDRQTLPELLKATSESLKQLGQDGSDIDGLADLLLQEVDGVQVDTSALLTREAERIETDISQGRQRLDKARRELEQLWESDEENEYELSSVFIHLGAAGYGHYYLYQRALPSQPDRWLKYNDAAVTDVDVSEVFADTTDSTANPYWLTYVRKSEIPRRIDAVCRQF